MFKFSLKLLFIFLLVPACFVCANAQTADASSDGRNNPFNQRDLPDGIKESLAKKRIENEEKEYNELIDNGEEAAKLGTELSEKLERNQKFSSDDLKKLDRLEKLVKKIRSDLGAKDDSDSEDSKTFKSSLYNAGKTLQETTGDLLSEIKKIGRHTISVVAIESSNSLLKLVRYLRFNK